MNFCQNGELGRTSSQKNSYEDQVTLNGVLGTVLLCFRCQIVTYPCLLVDADDEGWVPLGGALHPVHAQPLAQQQAGGGEQDALGRRLVTPGPHLALWPRAHSQPRGLRLPFLKIGSCVKTSLFVLKLVKISIFWGSQSTQYCCWPLFLQIGSFVPLLPHNCSR